MLIGYTGFSILLAVWVWLSGVVTNPKSYLCMVIYMLVLGVTVCTTWDKKSHTKREALIALVLVNLGLAMACRMGEKLFGQYMLDIFLMSIAFLIVYVLVRYTRLTEVPILNWMLMALLPVALFAARFGKMVNGSYLTICGVPVFALVGIGYPFVVAYMMKLPETKFLGGNIKHLSKPLILLLGYTVLLFFGCAITNEFGLLLILGITATSVFFVKCKNYVSKLIYTSGCVAGAAAAANWVPHIHERIDMWLYLEEAIRNPVLKDKMGWNLYLFQTLKQTGWFGKGNGSMSKFGVYGTLNTDHSYITLINDFSLFIALGITILACVWIWSIMKTTEGARTYDYYLHLSIGLIIGMLFLLHISSNLSSFITAGIPLAFISNASAVNIMLAMLLAAHTAVDERRREDLYDEEEEKLFE